MISRCDERGFTLLELLAVLFVLGVASAIVITSVGRSFDKAALREEAARLRNTLRHSRELSLMERRPLSFMINEDGDGYWLEQDGEQRGKGRSLPRGMVLKGGEEGIIFFPKGNSTGGTVVIEDEHKRGYAVDIDKVSGEARLRRL